MSVSLSSMQLGHIITAVGGLGTAAFGLVDSTKVFWGGVNRIGFGKIKVTVTALTPGTAANGLSQAKIISTLRANWYNGQDLASQKAVAKSLIKLGLNAGNAAAVADAAGVDRTVLQSVATKMTAGTALTSSESDVFARFDLILTAMLDEAYQNGDQRYTNGTRTWAGVFAVLLALAGGWVVKGCGFFEFVGSNDLWRALIAGVLAVPLAPVAKNLSSALVAAVNSMQLLKK
ncbi:conserved membrane hypothetical protein [Candidatus Sulfotelmatomonas gaucii]|uniref:Uncharacterized protein n=1 Tax=Candidatus Sulfuritelmatomonas gaucii TaxID=2043161 RepID=A0A2N9LTN0_9BACT|nr:conserved membrane hypothetical protein [Candidatus Sulfotelmatomonas gaucii]